MIEIILNENKLYIVDEAFWVSLLEALNLKKKRWYITWTDELSGMEAPYIQDYTK